jgi:DNA-binding HxlR family transcriptional regulator
MSLYDKIDLLIMQAIKAGKNEFYKILRTEAVYEEFLRMEQETGRLRERTLDARLQALKRRGLIEFVRPFGWRVANGVEV